MTKLTHPQTRRPQILGAEIVFRPEWRDGQTFVLFSHEGWREPNEFMHHCSTKWATFLLKLERPSREGRRPSGAHGHEDRGGRVKRARKSKDKGVSFRNEASTHGLQ